MTAYAALMAPQAASAETPPPEACAPVYVTDGEISVEPDRVLVDAVAAFAQTAQEEGADYDQLKLQIVPDSVFPEEDQADLSSGETQEASQRYVESLFDACEWDEDGTVVLLVMTDHDEFRQYVGTDKDVTSNTNSPTDDEQAFKDSLRGEMINDDIATYIASLKPEDLESSDDDFIVFFPIMMMWWVIFAGNSSSRRRRY